MTRGPWYITMKALEDYLLLRGIDPATCSDHTLNRVEAELIKMAQQTVDSPRRPSRTRNGLLAYRGPRPLRLTLIVSGAARPGDLPQLVGVSGNPEHLGKKPRSRPAAKRRKRA